jgi:hypothetical protein
MDGKWFKRQHRLTGISQSEVARRLGKAQTFFTRVYDGKQQLRLAEAGAIAKIMGLPLSEVLAHAGLSISPDDAVERAVPKGFEESGVAPLHGEPVLGGLRPQGPGQSVWTVQNDDLAMAGYLSGDRILVDLNERPRKGDVVVAQLYDWRADTATTLLRIWRPPYLLRPAIDPDPPLTVDGERVLIKGVVVASWRHRPTDG